MYYKSLESQRQCHQCHQCHQFEKENKNSNFSTDIRILKKNFGVGVLLDWIKSNEEQLKPEKCIKINTRRGKLSSFWIIASPRTSDPHNLL